MPNRTWSTCSKLNLAVQKRNLKEAELSFNISCWWSSAESSSGSKREWESGTKSVSRSDPVGSWFIYKFIHKHMEMMCFIDHIMISNYDDL